RFARQGREGTRRRRHGGRLLHRIRHARADSRAPDPRAPGHSVMILHAACSCGTENAHSLSTCPPLSTDDKIARPDAASHGQRENSTVRSSTESTAPQIPGFHAGPRGAARIANAFFADKRGLDTEIAALVRLADHVIRSAHRRTAVASTDVLGRYTTRWTAVADNHWRRWRAVGVSGSAA